MRPLLFCVLTLFLTALSPLSSQTAPTDSQTLQALLAELRQLRHDLRSTNAMAQRAQIALYRLQRQDEAVVRANQNLSDVRNKLANIVTERNELTRQMQQVEALMRNSANPDERSHSEEVLLPELKARLAYVSKTEQEAREQESEAMQRTHDEQIKLDALNDTLDRLNSALEERGRN